MSDEQREQRAKNLLDNPLLKEAFDVLREDLMTRWESSGSTELEARESTVSYTHLTLPTILRV